MDQRVLPGESTATYEIVFDGGALGNPGKGYGSYEITSNGSVVRHQREDYGDNVTNNQAEYQTLIEALKWLATTLGSSASSATVVVNGDSLLVLNQLLGKWKVKNEGLRPLHGEAARLIRQFRSVSLVWHARINSVKRLGH
jgi:ribonuclease HI